MVADEVFNCSLTAPDANCSWQHSKRIVLYASKPTVGLQHGVTSIMFVFVCFLAVLDEKDVLGPFRRFRLYALRPTAGNQQCVMHVVMVPRGFCFGGF